MNPHFSRLAAISGKREISWEGSICYGLTAKHHKVVPNIPVLFISAKAINTITLLFAVLALVSR
jgi:hypothetical protein